jgi:hypothetical protein
MGRRRTRECTDSFLSLNVGRCDRLGYLWPGRTGTLHWSRGGVSIGSIRYEASNGMLTLRYNIRQRGGLEPKHCSVAVERMPCHFGGDRAWFHCPKCGRRAALLYLSSIFTCRVCLNLAYESQQEASYDRALRKAQRIHERLGGTGVLLDPIPKPKGMHWQTYFFHLQRMHQAESVSAPPWILRGLCAQ